MVRGLGSGVFGFKVNCSLVLPKGSRIIRN